MIEKLKIAIINWLFNCDIVNIAFEAHDGWERSLQGWQKLLDSSKDYQVTVKELFAEYESLNQQLIEENKKLKEKLGE